MKTSSMTTGLTEKIDDKSRGDQGTMDDVTLSSGLIGDDAKSDDALQGKVAIGDVDVA